MRQLMIRRNFKVLKEETIIINEKEYKVILEKDNTMNADLNIYDNVTTYILYVLNNNGFLICDEQKYCTMKDQDNIKNIDEIYNDLLHYPLKILSADLERVKSDPEEEIKRLINIILELKQG